MLNGVILPGEQHFSEERWVNDILNECHFDDCLWGYTIHVVEELCTRDPVVSPMESYTTSCEWG